MSDDVPEGDGVSRETEVPRETPSPSVVPGDPVDVPTEAISRVFGERAERATAYRELLASAGVDRGLIGPREVPRLWDRHLLNCAYLGEVIDEGASVIDIGSGAGLPGIPLALARPDVQVRLVEPLERRYTFLREAITALDLRDQVAVARGRAEDVKGEFSASVVTARAVAPLGTLYGWALPLVVTGGHLIAIKGRSASDEIAAAAATLQQMGINTTPEVLRVGPDEESGTTVVRVARGFGPLKSPKAPAAPSKRRPPRGQRR